MVSSPCSLGCLPVHVSHLPRTGFTSIISPIFQFMAAPLFDYHISNNHWGPRKTTVGACPISFDGALERIWGTPLTLIDELLVLHLFYVCDFVPTEKKRTWESTDSNFTNHSNYLCTTSPTSCSFPHLYWCSILAKFILAPAYFSM